MTVARQELGELIADVSRLLPAGPAAAADPGLRRRAATLRRLAPQVPVLGTIAAAAEQVAGSDSRSSAAALLDLHRLLRGARVGLTTAGLGGDLEPIPPAGPWTTAAPTPALYPIRAALSRAGIGRLAVLQEAVERGHTADLRLLPSLLDGLGGKNGELADFVAEQALPAFGPALAPDLLRGLNFKGKPADARRLIALCRVDPKAGARSCHAALAGGSESVRVAALKGLPAVAPADVEGVVLGTLGNRPSTAVRHAALEALASLHPRPQSLLAVFLDHLGNRVAWRSSQLVADVLTGLGASAVEPLVSVLQDPEPLRRAHATYILGRIGPTADGAVPALLAALADADPDVRSRAIRALGRIGARPPALLPALDRALQDPDRGVQTAAALAHIRLGGRSPEAVAVLTAVVSTAHHGAHVAFMMEDLGDNGAAALPALTLELNRASYGQAYIEQAIRSVMQADPETAILGLVDALQARDYNSRVAAVRLLGELGPPARAAVPALAALLHDEEAYVRHYAGWALGQIDPAAAEANT